MCKATTKKGTQCKNMGLYNGACHLHATDIDRQEQRRLTINQYSLNQNQLVDARTSLIPKPVGALPKPKRKTTTIRTNYYYYPDPISRPKPEQKPIPQFNGLDGAQVDINDRQNVHRLAVNKKILEATQFLINKYPIRDIKKEYYQCLDKIHMLYMVRNTEILDNPEPEHSITKTYNFCFFKYTRTISTPKQYVNGRIDQWNNAITILNKCAFYSSRPKILVLTLYHILSFQQNKLLVNLLINRFIEEIIDGSGVCAHGKTARLVNIFSGIDKNIGNDNRSTGEIIQEKMAEISKLEPSLREKAATEFFKDIDITNAEKQVWIDALLD